MLIYLRKSKVIFMNIISLVFFICVFFIVQTSHAETDLSEVYDDNTEITISGKIIDIALPKRGPIILKLRPGRMTYYVVTAPPWYLSEQDIVFSAGLMIEVKGSKYFDREGNIYIIGREIKCRHTGKKIILRDMNSRPLWGRHGMQRRLP